MSGADSTKVARGPIAPAPPVDIVDGWEVSTRRSAAALQLSDCTPLGKVGVRAREGSRVASLHAVRHREAARRADGTLVIGSGPDEWLVLGGVGSGRPIIRSFPHVPDGSMSAVDLTHGLCSMRLSGQLSARLLPKVCAVDFRDATFPQRSACRSTVGGVTTEVVRDDLASIRSYLLICERAAGQYLFDVILAAGMEYDIDVAGFVGIGW